MSVKSSVESKAAVKDDAESVEQVGERVEAWFDERVGSEARRIGRRGC